MNKIIAILAIALFVSSCNKEEIEKSVITQVGQIEVIGPDIVFIDENAGVVSLDIRLSENQIFPTSFIVKLDTAASTATPGVDFIFETTEFLVDAFVQKATIEFEVFLDDEVEETETIIFSVIPAGDENDFTNILPYSFEVQLANGTSDDFEIRNGWDGVYNVTYNDTTFEDILDTQIVIIDTTITFMTSTQEFDTVFTFDTVFNVIGVDTIVALNTPFTLSANSALPICGLFNVGLPFNVTFVDFDVYGVNDTGGTVFANYVGCPAEIAFFEHDPDAGGYTTLDENIGADRLLPYGVYTIEAELFINLMPLVGIPNEIVPFNFRSTFVKPGVFVEEIVDNTTWSLSDGGLVIDGDGKLIPLYTIELADNFVRVSRLDNTEIISGRKKSRSIQRIKEVENKWSLSYLKKKFNEYLNN